MQSDSKTKFGLIIPKKTKVPIVKSVLKQDDSDEDDNTTKFTLSDQSKSKTFLRKQTQLHIEGALAEDANIFDYDASYEDDKRKREEKEEERFKEVCRASKPKYMGGLLRQAEERKKERLLRMDRVVAKERKMEEEEGLFQDKEKYVTEAYKESRRKMQEEQRQREEALKEAQPGDLTGFYRHLFEQKTKSAEEIADDNDAEDAKRKDGSQVKEMKKEDEGDGKEGVRRKRNSEDEGVRDGTERRNDKKKKEYDTSDRRKENDRTHNLKVDQKVGKNESEKKGNSKKGNRKEDDGKEEERKKVLPSKRTESVDDARARYLARKNAASSEAAS